MKSDKSYILGIENTGNSKTSDFHRLLLNLSDKINSKESDKYVVLSILSFTIHGKNLKSCTKIIDLKYQLQHGMKMHSRCIRYFRLF